LVKSALAIATEIDHRAWITLAHQVLGEIYLDLLALPAARQHLEQALSLAREHSSMYRLRLVTGILAKAYVAGNQLARAEELLNSFPSPETAAQTLGQRLCWCARAELALARDEPEQAVAIADRLIATAVNVENGDQSTIPGLALLQGEALAALRRTVEAEAALQAARAGAARHGNRPLQWRSHVALGGLYRLQARQSDAEREFRAAGLAIETLAATIPEETIREAFRQQAAARLPHARRAAARAPGGLSGREREVAALIAQGKTNGEIAAALVVSKRTVETHVGSILSKLGFSTRAQIIAWALSNDVTTKGRNIPRNLG
jgi:DNA-binding NarL/FixJ family response regulator